jgi:hypothetical protein
MEEKGELRMTVQECDATEDEDGTNVRYVKK